MYIVRLTFKGENSTRVVFIKYAFNIGLLWDTCKSTRFKLGLLLVTTKFYGMIPVWVALIFTQSHRVTGKLELAQSVVKWHKSTQEFAMVVCNLDGAKDYPWSMANMNRLIICSTCYLKTTLSHSERPVHDPFGFPTLFLKQCRY